MANRTVTTLPVEELTVGSGNWDASRGKVDRIIIHTMVGTIASANARFNIPNEQASAHYGVGLNGRIVHWVDEDNTAYHCGNYAMNQRSIGIEHEDNGNYNAPRTDALYTASAKLVRDICQFYSIPIDAAHILPHRQVSDKPTACPDALDIDRIIREAKGAPVPVPTTTPTPAIGSLVNLDADHQRALQVLEDYRKTRKEGSEGNFEGYVRVLVERDSRFLALTSGLSAAKDTISDLTDKLNKKPVVSPSKAPKPVPPPPVDVSSNPLLTQLLGALKKLLGV